MINRNYIDKKNQSLQAGLKLSILHLQKSISNKVKTQPEFEPAWSKNFPSDRQFTEKVNQEDYANLLLKALEFVDDVVNERKVHKTHSLKTAMSIRKEKNSSICQQLTESIKSNIVGTGTPGSSRKQSLDKGKLPVYSDS